MELFTQLGKLTQLKPEHAQALQSHPCQGPIANFLMHYGMEIKPRDQAPVQPTGRIKSKSGIDGF